MRPSVATVLSARSWEPTLARTAHHSGLVRLVGRVLDPIDLEGLPRPDWVVVGAETAWLGDEWVATMHQVGVSVVGIFSDEAEAGTLERMGVDVLAPAGSDPVALLERLLLPVRRPGTADTQVFAVVGTPGSGVTTVAVGLALVDRTVALVDTDPIPGVGPVLGMAPPDRMRIGASDLPAASLGPDGPLVVTAGGEPDVAGAVQACRRDFTGVVVDACGSFHDRVGWCATDVVLVVDASVQGMLRAIALVDGWAWPEPRLVLNRVTDVAATVEAARLSLGLEPSVCIPLSLDPLGSAEASLAGQSSGRLAAG